MRAYMRYGPQRVNKIGFEFLEVAMSSFSNTDEWVNCCMILFISVAVE